MPASYYAKYRTLDVKQALERIYDGLCCYCESPVGTVDYPHIEHRKPKNKFPEGTYDWNNLHIACQKCNVAKGEKFDNNYPILDAVEDVPIANHIAYDIVETGVWRIPITCRGNITIEHTELNREPLRTTRVRVLRRVLGIIQQIKKSPGSPAVNTVISQLREMTRGEYGSLVKYAMSEFLSRTQGSRFE